MYRILAIPTDLCSTDWFSSSKSQTYQIPLAKSWALQHLNVYRMLPISTPQEFLSKFQSWWPVGARNCCRQKKHASSCFLTQEAHENTAAMQLRKKKKKQMPKHWHDCTFYSRRMFHIPAAPWGRQHVMNNYPKAPQSMRWSVFGRRAVCDQSREARSEYCIVSESFTLWSHFSSHGFPVGWILDMSQLM